MDDFFNNNMKLNPDGTYPLVQRRLDKYFETRPNPDGAGTNYIFSAAPIKKWTVTPTEEIKDNSGSMFDDDGNFQTVSEIDDLPFD